MTTDREKEVNRLKQSRRNALLNLAAQRMGFTNWRKFESTFTNNLAAIPADATGEQVNASIREIVANLSVITVETPSKTDKELASIAAKYPRLRRWVIKKK